MTSTLHQDCRDSESDKGVHDSRYRLDQNGSLEIRCSTCDVYQPCDDLHFAANPRTKYGRNTTCRACAAAKTAAWRRTHREAAAAQRRRSYARTVAAGTQLTAEERQQILDEAGHRCAACGSTDRLELDHIIPLARGGSHRPSNRQILCHTHNLRKGTNIVDYRVSISRRAA